MTEDIRDTININHSVVTELNFISSSQPFVFRKHFRQGLRSHVLELLDPTDVTIELSGTIIDGIRKFPKAAPRYIFRIFRTRLNTLDEAWAEIERVNLVHHYLAPEFIAHSNECIVEYHGPHGSELMLCGLQDYITGEIIDPWTILSTATLLPSIYNTMREKRGTMVLTENEWIAEAHNKGLQLTDKIKTMITHSGHVPDLAGVGNLMMTTNGNLCLIDINNISQNSNDSSIPLDDKGYPVFDKSIEALSLIEEKIGGRPIDMNEKIYSLFLNSKRKKMVEEKVELFCKEFQAKDR